MKKIWPFLFSSMIALGIAYYSKRSPSAYALKKAEWKTFEKNSNKIITTHPTTMAEMESARIPVKKRSIAQEKTSENRVIFDQDRELPHDRIYPLREGRLLIGDLDRNDYSNDDQDLIMINKVNPNWKEILGNDLLRFQAEDTKVIIKEEYPVIKIQNGKGQYLEQVVVTYLTKEGFSSYHALVDSDSGFVTMTWDRTVNEKVRPERAGLSLPEYNNSGIIAR
ncbi:MAG: hypothetical protein ACXVLQ_13315 [Bacteriovorax sp.]